MASEMRELRLKARKLGATSVREMTRSELVEFIEENSNGKASKKKSSKAVAKAIKKRGRPPKVEDEDDDDEDEDEDEVEETPRKRGRPKGTKNKTASKKVSAKRSGRPAKSSATRKKSRSGVPGRPEGSGTGTRVLLPEEIDWEQDFDFREGSIQHYILNAIRKVAQKESDTAEIRALVFDRLVDKIGERDELTFTNRATGKPHKGEAAEARLKYYISRTMFDYAVNTGQHEGSGNTEAYVRGNGSSVKSRPAKRGRPRKVREEEEDDDYDEDEEEETPRKRGRPKGSTNKKRGLGRPKGSGTKNKAKRGPGRPPKSSSVKRGPGRPKGSKKKARRSSR